MQVSISRTMTDQQSPLLLARDLLKLQTHADMNSSPLQEHPVPGGGAVLYQDHNTCQLSDLNQFLKSM